MSEKILIDRIPAIKLFESMLVGTDNIRILRITGSEKMGKSRLLREFRKLTSSKLISHCALIDLKSRFQSYEDVVFQITQQLIGVEFKYVDECRKENLSSQKVEVKELNLLLSAISVNVSNSQSEALDSQNRHKLTDAFCRDLNLAKLTMPLVLQFDTFDNASPKIQDWLNEQLIPSLLQIPNVYLIVAGRLLPEMSNVWLDSCKSYTLLPVTLEDHLVYCKSLGIDASEEVIQAFHEVFNGTPGLFAEYAGKLKKEETQ